MTPKPNCVNPAHPLSRAAEIKELLHCGCVPVVDEREGLVGVLTDLDVCLAAVRSRQPLSDMTCGSAVSAPVHVRWAEDTIGQAERLVAPHPVRRVPVLDADDRLADLVSLDDLSREASRQADLQMHSLGRHEVWWKLGRDHAAPPLAYMPPPLDGPGT